MTRAIAYPHAAYVFCALPGPDGWRARALFGECTVAAASGPTAEAALAELRNLVDRLDRQRAIPAGSASSQASS